MSLSQRFTQATAITQLMDDLNRGAQTDDLIMLGGGNPALIPAVEQALSALLATAQQDGSLLHAISHYDGPLGSDRFRHTLADYLVRQGWPVSPEHIAVTNGSQSAFFALINLLAGSGSGRGKGRVVLPMVPEYVGYGDLALEPDLFYAHLPHIIRLGPNSFSYQPDLETLPLTGDEALICLSRPTNPTGHLISDADLERLRERAAAHEIPLLLDLAYGQPFPAIQFEPSQYSWQPGEIACLSLSKLGLPGVRTGMVIADPEVIRLLGNFAGVAGLAPGSIGPALATPLFADGSIDHWCQQLITPYYHRHQQQMRQWLTELIADPRFAIHHGHGTFFLWLWFEDMGFDGDQLYRSLMAEGVLAVPGHHFCPGRARPWHHARQCLRLSLAQDLSQLELAAARISKVVARLARG